MGVSQYLAFSVAYGSASAAFASLAGVAAQIASAGPYLGMVAPILEVAPETSERRPALARLSGGFELSSVTFSYGEGLDPVLSDLSLRVRPGEYVAVVGRTGCGKSTLLRLLLGFERPGRGAVYYDGHDLSSVDAGSVRRHTGVVLQNGQLVQGTVYENIALSSPGSRSRTPGRRRGSREWPTTSAPCRWAWRPCSPTAGAASRAGSASASSSRAVAGRPKILMFDEATSALDNVAQRAVSEALDGLRCTRLVIAHRLSTIRNADRVVVIEGGRIVEDGPYDELLALGGAFARLVERQQM